MSAADWTSIEVPQDIRLVVADMDGTLLDEHSEIPQGFWPMLARLRSRGVEFVPASGRQYATLRAMFADKAAQVLDGGELSYIAENGNVVAIDGNIAEVHGVDTDVTFTNFFVPIFMSAHRIFRVIQMNGFSFYKKLAKHKKVCYYI